MPLPPVPGSAPRFAPEATVRRLVVEPAVSFGAGRALLLQVAHPAVGQGVADHSDFQHDPFTRLFGTLEAVVAVVFGERELADDMGRTPRTLRTASSSLQNRWLLARARRHLGR